MKIKSYILKSISKKIVKGAGNNPMLPLTSLLSIECKDNKLKFTSMDGRNMLSIIINDLDNNENFYTIVDINVFSKIIEKTTTEYIEITNNDSYLSLKSNGSYKLNIAVNEDGDLIKFNDIPNELLNAKAETIDLVSLKQAIKTAKASVSKDVNDKLFGGYYLNDSLMATNSTLVCKIQKQFVSEPLFISYNTAELLSLIDLEQDDKLVMKKHNNILLFESNQYIIYSSELDNKDLYEHNVVTAINNLINLNYTNEINVDKNNLLDALDRISVFINYTDENAVTLKIDAANKMLSISNLTNNAVENISINEGNDISDYTCNTDINMLKAQIKSLDDDIITIQYGEQKSIQLKENDTILVVALLA